MPFYMTMKQQQLDDPATVEFYRDLAEAITGRPTTHGWWPWASDSSA